MAHSVYICWQAYAYPIASRRNPIPVASIMTSNMTIALLKDPTQVAAMNVAAHSVGMRDESDDCVIGIP